MEGQRTNKVGLVAELAGHDLRLREGQEANLPSLVHRITDSPLRTPAEHRPAPGAVQLEEIRLVRRVRLGGSLPCGAVAPADAEQRGELAGAHAAFLVRSEIIGTGDGAVLMHMGAMAVVGANAPENLIHVVINNGAHETVGGMPTVAAGIDLVAIAKACGYPNAVCVDSFEALDRELEAAKSRHQLSLIEVKCSIGAREDLGRPTTTALENKVNFMKFLAE